VIPDEAQTVLQIRLATDGQARKTYWKARSASGFRWNTNPSHFASTFSFFSTKKLTHKG